jgi:FAD/FMN-containing dehydrogenase
MKEGKCAMKFNTLDGSLIDLPQDKLDNFKMRIRGPILTPGDSGYEDCRSLWNGMIDRKPGLIVRCIGTQDVIASVEFSRDNNILLCIRGGGHNIAGLASAEGGLMLDMSLMRGVWVDEQKKVAHAQAGCQLGDVDRETQLHGLAAVLGFVSQTGIAGLTLGGGFGYLTRRWGWTADNVLGMDVVTAEGKLVRASNEVNPDLFWGLRGGGGNFGIVTGIDYVLYNVGPEVIGGIVAWPVSEAPGVLGLYRELIKTSPSELTLVALIRPAPPAPWLPKEIHGKLIIALLACYSGKPEDGEKLVAPIKSFGSPVGDVLIKRPYTQLQSMLDATQPKGRRYYWKSEYLADIEPSLCEKFIKNAEMIKSPHSAVVLFQIEGALNKLRTEHSPVGNRNAKFALNITAAWEKAEEDSAHIAWARNAWNDMKEYSTGGAYVNFMTEDEGPERNEAAFGKALTRLAQVKAKWDPKNMFRTNRNIKPATERDLIMDKE